MGGVSEGGVGVSEGGVGVSAELTVLRGDRGRPRRRGKFPE